MAIVPGAHPAIGSVACPQCKKTMRPHCRDWRCGWAYCGICVLTLSLKGRTSFGKFTGSVDT
jgi:hypothetical protein